MNFLDSFTYKKLKSTCTVLSKDPQLLSRPEKKIITYSIYLPIYILVFCVSTACSMAKKVAKFVTTVGCTQLTNYFAVAEFFVCYRIYLVTVIWFWQI